MEIDPTRLATKDDLAAVETRLNERHEMLRAELGHTRENVIETMRDVQTEILKAFYGFAETNSKRLIEIEGNENALRSRVTTLENRVLELERRLNMPPQTN